MRTRRKVKTVQLPVSSYKKLRGLAYREQRSVAGYTQWIINQLDRGYYSDVHKPVNKP